MLELANLDLTNSQFVGAPWGGGIRLWINCNLVFFGGGGAKLPIITLQIPLPYGIQSARVINFLQSNMTISLPASQRKNLTS